MLYARKRDAYEYFIILIAFRRNPADRESFDKALMGENLDFFYILFFNQDMLGLFLYVRSFVPSMLLYVHRDQVIIRSLYIY